MKFLSVFGLHEKALALKSHRMGVISKNIANADTPRFKAKDVDFKQVLSEAMVSDLRTTHSRHIAHSNASTGNGEYYTVPFNPSIVGNTVEISVEQAKYGKAAAEYQASLRFIESRVSGIRKALRGE